MRKFEKGKSGNPAGRPKGSRNRATLLALAAMEGELEGVVKSVIDAAKKGDMTAARLVVDKLIPATKDRPLEMTLPEVKDLAGCKDAQASILAAVATGEITLSQGEQLSNLIDSQRRSMETEDVLSRLKAIEDRLNQK